MYTGHSVASRPQGIDSPVAGPSTFRPSPAIGVTYLLDTEEEDIERIVPLLPPVDGTKDQDYDPRADQHIDEDDPEENLPYPTPLSRSVRGKRKAVEIYDVDEEQPRQSERLHKKKTRRARRRKEPECIYISSDSEDDVVQIPKPSAESKQKQEHKNPPPKQPIAPSRSESEQDLGHLNEKSTSPEADMGSVERLQPDAPNWIQVQLTKLRRKHPRTKLEICYHYSIDGDVWTIKCHTCALNGGKSTFSVGPGQSLEYLSKHLKGSLHQTAQGSGPSAGSSNDARRAGPAPRHDPSPQPPLERVMMRPTASARRERAMAQDRNDGDDVERFLDQLSLPVDLAPKLRSFGFESDERMSQIGRLSDESLGLLLDRLEQNGVDLVKAIMVREGLKQRAGKL